MATRLLFSLFGMLFFMASSAQTNNRLVILSDEDCCESPFNKKKSTALTATLSYFIEENEALILVSRSVLHQYLLDQAKNSSADPQINNSILIFKVQDTDTEHNLIYDTSYYLVAPVKYLASQLKNADEQHKQRYGEKKSFNSVFGLQADTLLNKINPSQSLTNQWLAMADLLASDTSSEGFASQFWSGLFLTKEHVGTDTELLKSWSIMFFCHGSPTATSGISIQDLRTFFMFLSEELTTNVVTMTCCYLAGSIKDQLCAHSITCEPITYNFDLIIAGLSDVPQMINSGAQGVAEEFFAQHDTKLGAIDATKTVDLFTYLITTDEFKLKPDFASFGQIRCAGTTTFTVPSKEVFHITPSKNITAAQASECLSSVTSTVRPIDSLKRKICLTPLQAPSKKIILLYVESFRRPLEFKAIIGRGIDTMTSPIMRTDHYLQTFLEWEQEIDTKKYPAIAAAKKTIGCKQTTLQHKAFVAQTLERLNPFGLHYPHIFSMLPKTSVSHHPGVHFFDEIIISNQVNASPSPFIGIFHFIHDAFFYNRQRYSENKFFMKTLRGHNDLSLLFECEDKFENKDKINHIVKMQLPHQALHKNLGQTLHHLAGKDIELTNVIVQSCFRDEDKKSICHVIFSINSKQDEPDELPDYSTWECLFEIPKETTATDCFQWRFLSTDTNAHTSSFEFEINNLDL